MAGPRPMACHPSAEARRVPSNYAYGVYPSHRAIVSRIATSAGQNGFLNLLTDKQNTAPPPKRAEKGAFGADRERCAPDVKDGTRMQDGREILDQGGNVALQPNA
jgi:hypothetical protein